MNVLILGCGTIGGMVAAILAERGHRCVGVRRTTSPPVQGMSTLVGDLADPALYRRLGMSFDAVLISANPGLRRGRDNGLAAGALLVGAQLPRARLVYTGTTAVYADAGGADVDESGALADDPAVAGLLAIERAVCAHPGALAFRIPALVGPTRTHASERLRRGDLTVRGDLDRPFSFLHEEDCAELCAEALLGAFGSGILNAASPARVTVRAYYHSLALRAGSAAAVGGGETVPSRWIDAGRLQRMCPGRTWRDHAG